LLTDATPLGRMASTKFPLRKPFALRCRLRVLVRHMETAVAQVVADCELMFPHICQLGSDCMSKLLLSLVLEVGHGAKWNCLPRVRKLLDKPAGPPGRLPPKAMSQ
jgi:hypothetical protein